MLESKIKILKALKVPNLFTLTSEEKTQKMQLFWDSFMVVIKIWMTWTLVILQKC